MEYAHYNLIEDKKQSQLLEQVLKDLPYLDPNYHPHNMITKGLCYEHVQLHEHQTSKYTHMIMTLQTDFETSFLFHILKLY